MNRKIVIIPARGGSKRIPNKNNTEFLGKPLIAYSIEVAKRSKLFDKIHVSTEDPAIYETAAALGAPIDFLRPKSLADDHSPLIPVIRWVLKEYVRRHQKFSEVCLLMPCAPLISSEDLVGAYKTFVSNNDGLPVIGVTEFPVPVEWAFGLTADGILDPRAPDMLTKRSQDLEKSYYDCGAFSFHLTDQVLQESTVSGGKMRPYILPRYRAIDIDEPEDLILAEIMCRGLKGYQIGNK